MRFCYFLFVYNNSIHSVDVKCLGYLNKKNPVCIIMFNAKQSASNPRIREDINEDATGHLLMKWDEKSENESFVILQNEQ